jgi:tRNA 5-methylaminomethyl-2-thiouridine biosynthesis bifunctional protein
MKRAKINFDSAITSSEFDDIYFSKDDAIAESTYIFLDNNHLPKRFKESRKNFSIAELGFGSGLNFLLTADLWHKRPLLKLAHVEQVQGAHGAENRSVHEVREDLSTGATQQLPLGVEFRKRSKEEWLNYYAIEGYPMSTPDLARTLSHFSDNLNKEAINYLLSAWDNLKAGINTITFPKLKIKLTLIIGDISEFFTHLPNNSIQAWYLDGFAPSKNPAMWEDYIYLNMLSKSSKEATFSTFTSAAKVRRGLINAGFAVEKVKGYGRKREMLRGQLAS